MDRKNMKRTLKWLGLILLTLLVVATALGVHTWYSKPLAISWFYNRVFMQFAIDNPELLTQLRMLEQVGIHSHNAKLGDSSLAHEDKVFAKLVSDEAMLRSYDTSSFKGQDKLSYDILAYFLGNQVRGEPWRFHNYPVNQLFGVQSNLPNLMTESQQVNNATDAEDYIARIGEFPRKMAQVIEGVKFRESKGIIPPKLTVEKVIEQVKGFLAPGVAGNPIVISFKDKISKIAADKMNETTRAALIGRVEQGVGASVLPAYNQLNQYMETLRPKATKNDGVWALPDGDKYYQYEIESNTTTTMKADEIHQIGLKEVARIGAEMDRILTEAGYTEGTRAERIQKLSKSPAQLYPDSEEGRAQILKDYQSIIDEMIAGLDKNFATKPKALVDVKRVPVFTEKTAPGAYYNGPPMDGSKPGTFFANLRDVAETPKFGMRTLAYHEAVPGHHMQIAIAQELKGLPVFRGIIPFTAYAEGWALYAEQFAWETGYQKNPLDNLGRLQAEMFRAVRLVVDTGMHAKRWTREQAIEYMMANTGMPEGEVVTEIERYLVMPGQALAYKVGMLKILELRERAKTALGAKFDIREFHDAVLTNGSMPLSVLENVIDAYIAGKKGA
jgi:uncharacterized protein (DUF885 family)